MRTQERSAMSRNTPVLIPISHVTARVNGGRLNVMGSPVRRTDRSSFPILLARRPEHFASVPASAEPPNSDVPPRLPPARRKSHYLWKASTSLASRFQNSVRAPTQGSPSLATAPHTQRPRAKHPTSVSNHSPGLWSGYERSPEAPAPPPMMPASQHSVAPHAPRTRNPRTSADRRIRSHSHSSHSDVDDESPRGTPSAVPPKIPVD